MNTKSELFFIDLEETIIHSFSDPVLCNASRIRDFLWKNDAKEIHIFSYAIYNDADKEEFNRDIKTSIQSVLGLPIVSCASVLDMVKADEELTGVKFEKGHEVSEFIQLRGKKDGFINYVLARCGKFTRAVLIDDIVPDITLTGRKDGWSIELWNVNSI